MPLKSDSGIIMGYRLPEDLRKEFKDPIGQLFTGDPVTSTKIAIEYINSLDSVFTLSIGDFCTKFLIEQNFYPDMVIFDETTRREKNISVDLSSYQKRSAINPREWILTSAWTLIQQSIAFSTSNNCRIAVRIDGEEDLLIIPAIISLPIGSIVVYGQPPITTEEGIVVVKISASLKDRITSLLEKFEYHEELTDGNHSN